MPSIDFAILAPVPKQHLVSGRTVSDSLGLVAFGTDTVDFFTEVDERREGQPVPVFFYASRDESAADEGHAATWAGWYVGHVVSTSGGHPAGLVLRPASAHGDGAWSAFYHVTGLHPLGSRSAPRIDELASYESGKTGSDARVRRCRLVRRPIATI